MNEKDVFFSSSIRLKRKTDKNERFDNVHVHTSVCYVFIKVELLHTYSHMLVHTWNVLRLVEKKKKFHRNEPNRIISHLLFLWLLIAIVDVILLSQLFVKLQTFESRS